ncbi:MAG TPA: cupredoxin domain-containing protein [Acidimicrobiales bacterium]|nr:cupredoxin domain-containing protein [Acidimicrobiales bacterium]
MTSPLSIDPGAAWRTLLRFALILLIAVGVLVHLFVQVPIPPIIVLVVLFVVALFLLGRQGRARTVGVVLGGISALLFTLGNLPFLVEDLAHPDSVLAFVASGAGVVGTVIGFVAMLGALLRLKGGAVKPLLGLGVLAVLIVMAVGLASRLGVDSDEAEAGDVTLVAEDADYFPEGADPERDEDVQISVDRGGALFVDNKDLYRHTFTVEALGLDEEVPAGVDKRIVIDAAPGQYEFICDVEGHEEDMRGTLTVR